MTKTDIDLALLKRECLEMADLLDYGPDNSDEKLMKRCSIIAARLCEMAREIKRLETKLQEAAQYVNHKDDCQKGNQTDHCTCGVMQLIPELFTLKRKAGRR